MGWAGGFKNKNTTYPDVLGIQAVFAPRRCDAAVEIRAGATHVQLVLVGLRGDVVPHLGAGKQELQKARGPLFSVPTSKPKN